MPSPRDAARRIDLYFESPAEKAAFQAWAKEMGCPLSPLILAKLREVRAAESRPAKPAASLKELDALRAEVKALREELAQRDAMIEILRVAEEREEDLEYSTAPRGHFSESLITLLRERGPLHGDTLVSLLGISDDVEHCRAIQRQLESLEKMGLIKKGPRGWRWI